MKTVTKNEALRFQWFHLYSIIGYSPHGLSFMMTLSLSVTFLKRHSMFLASLSQMSSLLSRGVDTSLISHSYILHVHKTSTTWMTMMSFTILNSSWDPLYHGCRGPKPLRHVSAINQNLGIQIPSHLFRMQYGLLLKESLLFFTFKYMNHRSYILIRYF